MGTVLCLVAGLVLLGVSRASAARVTCARPAGEGDARDGGESAVRRRRLNATAAAAALLCAAAGATAAGLHSAYLRQQPVHGLAQRFAKVEAEVTVTSDARQTRTQVRGDRSTPVALLLDAEITRVTAPDGAVTRLRVPVLVIVSPDRSAAQWQRLLPSTRLRLSGRLSPPLRSGERNAAVLRPDGNGPPRVIGPPTLLQRAAGGLRAGLRTATEGLEPDARALLPGLVVGDTSRVTPELHDVFQAADLTHLMAVSGANLAILLVLLIGPPGTALRVERRGLAPRLGLSLRMTALLGGGLTLAFVLVCRPEPSVLRAAVCGLITLLAIGTGRRRSLIPALAAAVLLLVLYDPWLARSYGFVLSVLATGALLTVAPLWSAALRRRRVPPARGGAGCRCSGAGGVRAGGRGARLTGQPGGDSVQSAGRVRGGAGHRPRVRRARPCAGIHAGGPAARQDCGLAGRVDRLRGPHRSGPPRGGGRLARRPAGSVAACRPHGARGAVRPPHRAPPLGVFGAALLLILAVLRPVPLTRVLTGWPPPDWVFAMCDVGQGDAMVLAAGAGEGVVVDAGPDPRLADRCLHDLGVTRVPLLLLTHFHADHVRGLPGVLRGRAVGAIQTTSLDEPPEQAAFVRGTAAVARVPLMRAAPGERRRIGPLDWRVLWPVGGVTAAPEPEEPNDASVTLFVRTGGLTLLLLGDLEPPAQQGLLRQYPALPRVDVLKVAHHGSAHQDPALLRSAHPRLALVSVGKDNPYGHPAARTVDALRAGGAVVLRTDLDGAIAVTGSGPGLRAVGRS